MAMEIYALLRLLPVGIVVLRLLMLLASSVDSRPIIRYDIRRDALIIRKKYYHILR